MSAITPHNILHNNAPDDKTPKHYLVVTACHQEVVNILGYQYQPKDEYLIQKFVDHIIWELFIVEKDEVSYELANIHYTDEIVKELHKLSEKLHCIEPEFNEVLTETDIVNIKKIARCKRCSVFLPRDAKWYDTYIKFKCMHQPKDQWVTYPVSTVDSLPHKFPTNETPVHYFIITEHVKNLKTIPGTMKSDIRDYNHLVTLYGYKYEAKDDDLIEELVEGLEDSWVDFDTNERDFELAKVCYTSVMIDAITELSDKFHCIESYFDRVLTNDDIKNIRKMVKCSRCIDKMYVDNNWADGKFKLACNHPKINNKV